MIESPDTYMLSWTWGMRSSHQNITMYNYSKVDGISVHVAGDSAESYSWRNRKAQATFLTPLSFSPT